MKKRSTRIHPQHAGVNGKISGILSNAIRLQTSMKLYQEVDDDFNVELGLLTTVISIVRQPGLLPFGTGFFFATDIWRSISFCTIPYLFLQTVRPIPLFGRFSNCKNLFILNRKYYTFEPATDISGVEISKGSYRAWNHSKKKLCDAKWEKFGMGWR